MSLMRAETEIIIKCIRCDKDLITRGVQEGDKYIVNVFTHLHKCEKDTPNNT